MVWRLYIIIRAKLYWRGGGKYSRTGTNLAEHYHQLHVWFDVSLHDVDNIVLVTIITKM